MDYYFIIIILIIVLKVLFWSFYFYVRARRIQALRTLQQQQQHQQRIIIIARQHSANATPLQYSDRAGILANEEIPVPTPYPVAQPPPYDEALIDCSSKPPSYEQVVSGQANFPPTSLDSRTSIQLPERQEPHPPV